MKKIQWFIIFILLCSCFKCKKNKSKIRKLQETDDFSTEIDEPTSVESTYYSDITDEITNNSTYNEPKPKFILLGFSNFKKKNPNTITFLINCIRIYTPIRPKYIYIIIRIIYRGLRNLEEKTIPTTCISENKDNDINLEFKCEVDIVSEDITSISIDQEVTYLNEEHNNITDVETPFTSTANQTRHNIQNEDDDFEFPVIIENSTKSQNELTFLVNGEANDELKDGNVNLFLDENRDGNLQSIPCYLKKNINNKYDLECTPKSSISAHLNNVDGKTFNNKSLIISMKENEDDFIYINIPQNFYGNIKGSSKGLSGGTIAAIVICCVVAIIAIAIIAVLFNKPKQLQPVSKSAIDMFDSNVKITNN